MIHIFHPNDPTTEFLSKIYLNVVNECGKESIKNNRFSSENHSEIISKIKKLENNSHLIYIGHGTNEKLYGVHPDNFLEINSMSIFNNKNLLALSCDSTHLLKNSFSRTEIRNSIGFDKLPTEIGEIQNIKKLRNKKVEEEDIDEFKICIIEIISKSLIFYINNSNNFRDLYNYIKLFTNIEINNAVFEKGNRNLADILYFMVSGMIFLEKNI